MTRKEVEEKAKEEAIQYVKDHAENPNFKDEKIVQAFVETEVEKALDRFDEELENRQSINN